MYHPPIQFHDIRLGQNGCHLSSGNDQDMIQFRTNRIEEDEEDTDSGYCSPPLWSNHNNSSSISTPSSPSSQPLLGHHVSSTPLSPRSRLQAITRGQKELMDMVRNLPEPSYELSLQDLVEKNHRIESDPQPQQQLQPRISPLGHGLSSRKGGQGRIRKDMTRSGSFEIENTGLFLKMGFPFSVKSKKRSKAVGSGSGRVSPKPEGLKSGSSGDREWWKKKFTGSSDSNRSRASINSSSTESSNNSYGSNRNNNRRHRSSSCWPIFQSRGDKHID